MVKNIVCKSSLLLLVIAAAHLYSQPVGRCGTIYTDHNDPRGVESRMESDKKFNEWLKYRKSYSFSSSSQIIAEIPVVVHVLYNNSTTNISDEKIKDGIAILNKDYSKMNSDASKVVSQFKSVQADTRVRFKLATVDPQGNTTTGINRKQTTKTGFEYPSDVKYVSKGGVDPWDVTRYLNIWVVPEILYQGQAVGLMGNGQYPDDPSGPRTDGVVIKYLFFGSVSPTQTPYHLGRTVTHEAGHWLGLRHPWGLKEDGCNESDDDLIKDTPLQEKQTSACPLTKTSCQTLDMVQNFMDYSDDDCMCLFTKDQSLRIEYILKTYRSKMLNSTPISYKPKMHIADASNVDSKAQMFDIRGRCIGQHKTIQTQTNLSTGLYFLKIPGENGKTTIVPYLKY